MSGCPGGAVSSEHDQPDITGPSPTRREVVKLIPKKRCSEEHF